MEIMEKNDTSANLIRIVHMIYKHKHNTTYNQAICMNLPHDMKNSTESSLTNQPATNVPKTSH